MDVYGEPCGQKVYAIGVLPLYEMADSEHVRATAFSSLADVLFSHHSEDHSSGLRGSSETMQRTQKWSRPVMRRKVLSKQINAEKNTCFAGLTPLTLQGSPKSQLLPFFFHNENNSKRGRKKKKQTQFKKILKVIEKDT